MGTWNNLQKGFTVSERIRSAVANDCLWHISGCLVRQKGQIKKPPQHNFGWLWDDYLNSIL